MSQCMCISVSKGINQKAIIINLMSPIDDDFDTNNWCKYISFKNRKKLEYHIFFTFFLKFNTENFRLILLFNSGLKLYFF